MKRLFTTFTVLLASVLITMAQNKLNTAADNILGCYLAEQNEDVYKTRFTKAADGTYTCQMYYLRDLYDKDGKVFLDFRNPDKSLRNVRADQIVLIRGLKYNAAKQHWDGAKIYDPQRGLKANVTVNFTDDGRLRIRGTVLGIGETAYWKPIKEGE